MSSPDRSLGDALVRLSDVRETFVDALFRLAPERFEELSQLPLQAVQPWHPMPTTEPETTAWCDANRACRAAIRLWSERLHVPTYWLCGASYLGLADLQNMLRTAENNPTVALIRRLHGWPVSDRLLAELLSEFVRSYVRHMSDVELQRGVLQLPVTPHPFESREQAKARMAAAYDEMIANIERPANVPQRTQPRLVWKCEAAVRSQVLEQSADTIAEFEGSASSVTAQHVRSAVHEICAMIGVTPRMRPGRPKIKP